MGSRIEYILMRVNDFAKVLKVDVGPLKGTCDFQIPSKKIILSFSLMLPQGSMDILSELQLLAVKNLEKLELSKCYDVIRELGKGTYGRVDLVHHKKRGTKMALKFLRKKTTKEKVFLQELCISRYLAACPYIIDTYDIAFETEEHYVFAQEYAVSGDLFDIIPPQVGLPEHITKRCIYQVALALDHLHSRKLVHRDIKPENILIFDKECRKVKLSDFGMTRIAGSVEKRVSGTIPYTAPELCEVSKQGSFLVNYSIDVWAFGVLLFCMLTGNFPWEKALQQDSFYNEFLQWQSYKTTTVPSQWHRFTPSALKMFHKLLSPQPEKRCSIKDVLRFFAKCWLLTEDSRTQGLHSNRDVCVRVKTQTLSLVISKAKGGITRETSSGLSLSSCSSCEDMLKHSSTNQILASSPIEICV
ncbi:serine/threonine-protein kinase SBK1-like [Rhinatrema bivittatum]|uniref:serine/threonine-protein kinase SBK1-like n=1 Tax=Rhinatrema bivittatum TaxID=194408 RepID=UPI001128D0F7|nr:serine/threonine-protein kinase SBK1-like [Rhinatrema bivittatum]